jgi:hypothetical protein
MTDEQINMAIAEACGWVDRGSFNFDRPDDHLFKRPKLNSKEYQYSWQHEFNYCADLNAMHQAEKTLSTANMYVMEVQLKYVLTAREFYFHATARQRAEAFLRTLGKWKEAK